MSENNQLIEALTLNGDGTGTYDVTGNYVSATDFYIQPPPDEVFKILSLTVNIQDTGDFDIAKYGNGITLINGIKIQIKQGSTLLVDLTTNSKIIHNGDWKYLTEKFDYITYGAGDNLLLIPINFIEAFGQPIYLDGSINEKLVVTVQDDFTGLTEHKFTVRGNKSSS